jgi:hypothetical protein
MKRKSLILLLLLLLSSSSHFLAANHDQGQKPNQSNTNYSSDTKYSIDNLSKVSIFNVPFYAQVGLTLGAAAFVCAYYYGIYKGIQYIAQNGPIFFSSLSTVIKNGSGKILRSLDSKF